MSPVEPITDADLVAASLAGDRDAFGQIVERYQRLLCSLAYSATGRLSESEDLAQETFVEGWRRLPSLREPEKLRSWLCGILRFKVSHLRRADGKEPSRQADPLDELHDSPAPDQPVEEHAMNNEEQTLLWNALERVPERYREPLVLYYREHRSVEHVAVALELTEDAVKQRLSRGRKILQEQVLTFVEGALSRSTPGRAFTAVVLAALPAMSTPAQAAGLGAVTVKGGLVAKSAGLAGGLTSVSGAVNALLSLRAGLDQTRTPRERRAVVKITLLLIVGILGTLGVLYLLRAIAIRQPIHQVEAVWASQALVVAFVVGLPIAFLKILHRMRALRSEERRRHPEVFSHSRDKIGSKAGEYRSGWTMLGVPLVHIRYSAPDAGEPPVFGWVAGGDRAYGLLFAWGAYAVAPISVGVVSVGLVAVGSVSLGAVSLGTASIGLLAVGCMSIGVKAFAWLSALGWDTAAGGGFSIARNAALGPITLAEHANDPVAQQLLSDPNPSRTDLIIFAVVVILTVVPVALYSRAVRRRLGSRGRNHSKSD